jgi:hypothetical protein
MAEVGAQRPQRLRRPPRRRLIAANHQWCRIGWRQANPWPPRQGGMAARGDATMQLRSAVLGGVIALGAACAAQAQPVIDGSQVDEILNLARGYGSAHLDTQVNGDPKISGKIEGVTYHVYFMNCTDNENCEDLNFYAGFLDNKQTLDAINAWNRDKRFGKAYLDADLDAVVEFDVNLEHGVTRDNLDAAFSVWALVLKQFTAYIGHK